MNTTSEQPPGRKEPELQVPARAQTQAEVQSQLGRQVPTQVQVEVQRKAVPAAQVTETTNALSTLPQSQSHEANTVLPKVENHEANTVPVSRVGVTAPRELPIAHLPSLPRTYLGPQPSSQLDAPLQPVSQSQASDVSSVITTLQSIDVSSATPAQQALDTSSAKPVPQALNASIATTAPQALDVPREVPELKASDISDEIPAPPEVMNAFRPEEPAEESSDSSAAFCDRMVRVQQNPVIDGEPQPSERPEQVIQTQLQPHAIMQADQDPQARMQPELPSQSFMAAPQGVGNVSEQTLSTVANQGQFSTTNAGSHNGVVELQQCAELAAARVRLMNESIQILLITFKDKYDLDKALEKDCSKRLSALQAARTRTSTPGSQPATNMINSIPEEPILEENLQILASSLRWVRENLENLEEFMREKHRNVRIAGSLVDEKEERGREEKHRSKIEKLAAKIEEMAVKRERNGKAAVVRQVI